MGYPPVGNCIYCGKNRLPNHGRRKPSRFHDEHIVPLALGGKMVLPEASCVKCERLINKQIENCVLRKELGAFRDALGSPTRNKKAQAARRAKNQHAIVGFYRFGQAGVLTGQHTLHSSAVWPGLENRPAPVGRADLNPRKEDSSFAVRAEWIPRPDHFARLIAKIGYAFAVAELGLGSFTPFVQGLILGRDKDHERFVGSLERDDPMSRALSNRTIMLTCGHDETLTRTFLIPVMDIAIIPEATPIYYVVAGELDLDNAQHRRVYQDYRQRTTA